MIDQMRAFFTMLVLVSPAQAADVVTCTGVLSEAARTAWIVDRSAGRTCIVNLRGFEHDPLQPCWTSNICRVTGRGHSRDSTGTVYVFDEINDVAAETLQPPPQPTK